MVGAGNSFFVPLRGGGSGTLMIGSNNSFGFALAPCLGTGEILLQPRAREAEIQIGDGNSFSNNVSLIARRSIIIGSHCLIGDGVGVFDCDFHDLSPSKRRSSSGPMVPVVIENNVWLGSRVMVLKGFHIGENSIVGAMSLVTKSVPANCLVAGVPARVIRAIE